MLEAGVGFSVDPVSYSAGREVAKQSVENMTEKPKLGILVIDSLTRKKFNYPQVLQGVREELGPEVPIIGSTVNGIMVGDRFALKSVGLMTLGGDLNVDASFSYNRSRAEYREIANKLLDTKSKIPSSPNQLLLMFQDGMKFPPETMAKTKSLNSRMVSLMSNLVGRSFKKQMEDFADKGMGNPTVQEIIEILYENKWDIPIIGNVATNVADYNSFEFYNDKVFSDGIAGVFLAGQGSTKFGYGYAAGAEPMGVSCKITKNIGSFLLRLNDKLALRGFCEALGVDKEMFRELKNQAFLNVHQLIGTREKVGDKNYSHLTVTITDPELEGLIQSGYPFDKVPSEVEIFQSTTQVLLKSVQNAIREAMVNVPDPKFLLGIDCCIRFMAYGDNLPKVIQTVHDTVSKDIPIMMLGSGGEIWGTKPNDYYLNNVTFLTFVGG